MSVTVVILNYKRPDNIKQHIIPSLLSSPLIDRIVIAHGIRDTVFGVSGELGDGEILYDGKILHVGDYTNNQLYKCWRRWLLIIKTQYF